MDRGKLHLIKVIDEWGMYGILWPGQSSCFCLYSNTVMEWSCFCLAPSELQNGFVCVQFPTASVSTRQA